MSSQQKEEERKEIQESDGLSSKEIGLMGIGPMELCHLVMFILPFIWVWFLGWFGFSIIWSILIAVTVFAFRLGKFQYKSNHKMLQLLMDAVSLEDLQERNHIKRYALVEKFVEAKFPDAKIPKYIRTLDYEKMEWFNCILMQLWPFIGDYVKRLMKEQIEPQIAAAVPKLKISFVKFDLGHRQPRVERVKVYNLKEGDDRSYIDIDLQLNWVSDMEVELNVTGIPVTLKQLEFKGEMRVTLEPLITDVPIVGSIAITFLEPPCIDFNLDGVAAVANLPGVYQGIKMAIGSVLTNVMVLPKRIDIPLTDSLTNEIRCRLPAGICRVTVVQAMGLRDADICNKSDPYCIVKVGCVEKKTKTVNNDLNPVWAKKKYPSDRYVFDYPVHDQHTQIIHFEIFDDDDGTSDDLLGSFHVPVKEVIDTEEDYIDRWFNLTGEGHKKGSKVRVIIHWLELKTLTRSTVYKVDRSENDLNLDHFYFGVHLDKVLDLPPAARGKQIEAELKLSETFKNETTQHEKQKTLKVIGPDCSFASSFYYNLKTAEDILLKFEFTADTLLGEEEFDSFTITSENMKRIIDDPKNVFHLDAECPEKSKIKAKMVLRKMTGHPSAWTFPTVQVVKAPKFLEKPKIVDAIPESFTDTPRAMNDVIDTLSAEGLKSFFRKGSTVNLCERTDIILSTIKLQIIGLTNRDVTIKIVSTGSSKPLVGGSKLKFILGDRSESSKVVGVKGFIGQVIQLKRVAENDITVFSRKDKRNLAMGQLKQVLGVHEIHLYEIRSD